MSAEVLKIADDNGYSGHKIAWLGKEGIIQTHKEPTIIGSGQKFSDISGQVINQYRDEETGQIYTCDPDLKNPIHHRNAEYPISVENRVLMQHALIKSGFSGQDVTMGVTLPFRHYYGHGDGNSSVNWLKKPLRHLREDCHTAMA